MTVDAGMLDEIVANYGDPLGVCEGVRFGQTGSGYIKLTKGIPDGVLGQMGLERGDEIIAINGTRMDSLGALGQMAVDLFLGGRVTSQFSLVYRRGRETTAITVLVR